MTALLSLDGLGTLASCDALQTLMLEAVAAGRTVEIDCSAAASFDLSGIQILMAASRAARTSGSAFELKQPLGTAAANAFARAGLDPASLGSAPITAS